MLFQPTNITPSTFSGLGNGTVDVTEDLTVTWQVTGNSALTAYQITIMKNDTSSTVVYTGAKVTLEEPFFGVDFNGDVQYFSTVIPASQLSALSNGYENGYKLQITQWWGSTDAEKIVQTQASFFEARDKPTLTLSVPAQITSRSFQFTALYSQAQGDTLNWFRWMLSENGNVTDYLKDTGNIAGTEDVRMDYDGFFTGQSYMVRCIVETENGVEADTGWVVFDVSYELAELDGSVSVCAGANRQAILISWPAITYIIGAGAGNYAVSGGKLTMGAGSVVTWNQVNGAAMSLPAPWSVVWRGKVQSLPVSVLEITGSGHTLALHFTDTEAQILEDGEVIASLNISMKNAEFMTAVVTPTSFSLRQEVEVGSIYPSADLYPGETVFPEPMISSFGIYQANLILGEWAANSIQLNGAQVCDLLWVYQGEIPAEVIEELLSNGAYEPEYGSDTLFLANFENGLNAGRIASGSGDYHGTSLYRRESGSTVLKKIADLALGVTSVLDYGFSNQSSYTYLLFPRGEDTFMSAPLVSETVTPVFWDWLLLECTETARNIFRVDAAHVFKMNVSSGAIGNNNTPNLLTNFTKYPLRQSTAPQFKSGTLQAYIGKIGENGRYVDTAAQMEALYSLSVSAKPKFLRDRKGNFWRVETSAAVGITMLDGTREQAAQVSLPWAEVGSTDEVSVIGNTL